MRIARRLPHAAIDRRLQRDFEHLARRGAEHEGGSLVIVGLGRLVDNGADADQAQNAGLVVEDPALVKAGIDELEPQREEMLIDGNPRSTLSGN
jgi:hypothetical protein